MRVLVAIYMIFIYLCQLMAQAMVLPFVPFVHYLRRRFIFEKINNDPTDIAFEVASEGELEQVFPLIEYFRERGTRVKIIYSSESVAKKCQSMKQVITTPLPILRAFPIFKINAPLLILCRYDFYPNLLIHGLKNKILLLSASLKNRPQRWYRRHFYQMFDLIIPVNGQELRNFNKLGIITGEPFDFRVLQISKRLSSSSQKLDDMQLIKLRGQLTENSLIMGSCWPNDLEILSPFLLQKIACGDKLVIVPHKLESFMLDTIERTIENKVAASGIKVNRLSMATADITIIDRKGILLELYRLFKHAYVGGGFDRSIHSLLEPYLAGCVCYCGPRIHRSSEYDLIIEMDPQAIQVVTDPSTFTLRPIGHNSRSTDLIRNHQNRLPAILRRIESVTKKS